MLEHPWYLVFFGETGMSGFWRIVFLAANTLGGHLLALSPGMVVACVLPFWRGVFGVVTVVLGEDAV